MFFKKSLTVPMALLMVVLVGQQVGAAVASDTPQQLANMTVVDQDATTREELKVDSIENPYRVEASSRVAMEIFSAEDIANLNPSDVYDLLDKAVGINLTYQGRKSPFFITQRGGGSFTYIVDGAVLPSTVNRILYKFPVSSIEQLQIMRGATALTLGPTINIGASNSGSGLNTGFIIIRTKQPQETQAIVAASIEKSKGGHPAAMTEDLYLGAHFGDQDNKQGYVGGMLANMDRPSQDDWFDGRSGTGGMLNSGATLGKLRFNFMYYRDKGDFEMQRGISVDGTLSDVKWYYDPLETKIYSADASVIWSPRQTTILNLFQVQYDQTEHNDSFASTTTSTKEYEEKTSGIGLRHNLQWHDTLLQLGGQLSDSKGDGPNLSSRYNRFDTSVKGWSASLEQKFFADHLVFDLGYRRDVKHIKYSSTSAANDTANNNVDLAPAEVIAGGVHWQISDMFVVDGRYFAGDQGTSGDFDLRTLDGSDLHGEKQQRIEVALSANLISWFRPTVTWFDVDIKNAKSATTTTYVEDGDTYYYYTEADELRRGVELLIEGNIGKDTSYKASWTRMLDNETTSAGVTTDNIGESGPKNLYSLSLMQKWQAYRFNVSVKKVDEWASSSSPMGTASWGGLGDYIRVDANVKRDFEIADTLLTATLYGRNLGDKHYSTRYVTGYYPDRGLTVGLGLQMRY